MGLAQVVKLTPSDQVKHLSMLDDQSPSEPGDIANGSAEQAQAYELSRMVQRAHAHRLAEDSRRRAEQALLLQQAEKQKTRQLAEELQQVREVADRQRIQIAREQQARQEAAHLQVENLKVEADIAQFQQRTEEMALTRHQVAEEERKLLALEALNLEELMRHKNRIAAWSLVKQVAQVRKIDKTKTAVRQAPKEKARAASVVPTEKPNGKRKRANFSRYAQENRELE